MTSTPTRIAIVGGHGKVALQLLPLLLERGKEVVPLARHDDQLAELERMGGSPRYLDIEAADDSVFAQALAGCDAVVFAAGGGPDGNIERKRTVDLEGSLKSVAGARMAGIDRIVQVSAIGVDTPLGAEADEVWTAYVEAKRDADAALRDSGLAWTILRPGALTDDAATGQVALAPELERGSIPRADVAAVIAEVLSRPETAGHQWELVSGDASVSDAVTRALH
jgi:uncharacterized protein YbjT (DUF2867 family)